MPHLPPRSPRRERRDDNEASDNEDEYHQAQAGSRRKGPSGGSLMSPTRLRGDGSEQPTPLSPAYPPHHDLETSEGGYNSVQRARQVNPYDSPLNPPDQQYQPTSTYTPATPSSPGYMNQTFQQGPVHPMRRNVSGQIPNLSNHLNVQAMAAPRCGPLLPRWHER